MSASETNTEKAAKKHSVPLIGMAVVAIFGVVLIAIFTFIAVSRGESPEGAEMQVDSLSGEVEPADDGVAAPIASEGVDQ
ncbi:hypothetical protein ACXN5S_14740 [Pseudoroseicyclus sp. H15]